MTFRTLDIVGQSLVLVLSKPVLYPTVQDLGVTNSNLY